MSIRCPRCDSGLVQPLRWSDCGVRMRCPECESCFESVASAASLRELELTHEAGREALLATYQALIGESMGALADALAAGLERDLIGADDFLPRVRATRPADGLAATRPRPRGGS